MLKLVPASLRLRTAIAGPRLPAICIPSLSSSASKTPFSHRYNIASPQLVVPRFQSTQSHPAPVLETTSTTPSPDFTAQKTMDRIQAPPGLAEDTYDHAVDVLASTFEHDPFMRYFQLDEAAEPQTRNLSYAYLYPRMGEIIKSFIEEENATLITLPGREVASAWSIQTVQETEHPSSLPVPLQELLNLSSRSLKSSIPIGQRYIHAIVAGNRDPARGVYSGLIRPMLRLADELGLPVYGEATNEHSKDVHRHYGFEIGEVFYVGQGRVGADGMAEKGGSGVPHWPVLYRPKSQDRAKL